MLGRVNDDWRLQIDFGEDGPVEDLVERLDAVELEHDLSRAFADRVIVSRDGRQVFLYAGDREQIDRARALVAKVIDGKGWKAEIELRRWHPTAEEWEDPDRPLPASDAERRAEREEMIDSERRDVAEGGEPLFEVRVDLPSHHDAVAFDHKLHAEGLPAVRRWKYLVVGAADEDSGAALAERLREEAPAGSTVTFEGSGKVAWEERPANPFAIFGGLGG
jgi:hypothetical protein